MLTTVYPGAVMAFVIDHHQCLVVVSMNNGLNAKHFVLKSAL